MDTNSIDCQTGIRCSEMKRHHLRLIAALAALALGSQLPAGEGIPEPGLIIYGNVSNLLLSAVSNSTLIWTNLSVGEIVIVPATWVVVNGQVFHFAHIPFETRFSGTPQALPATPNTFKLPSSPAAFSRSVALDGQPLQFVLPNQAAYTFGPADRGRMDRVDLVFSGSGETFEQWIARFPAIPPNLRGPNDDPDGDGVSNHDEFIAGTDPADRTSVFKLDSTLKPEVSPDSFAGIVIEWSSAPGKHYTIERTTDLQKGFVPVALRIQATDAHTSFRDSDARGAGPFFYRIRVE
jgi:hypothetical protein